MVKDAAGNNVVITHDFSISMYRWAYDYFNSVNDLIDRHPGLQMFPVKYNNACLAFELIIKSLVAFRNHAKDPSELNKIMLGYSHSLVKLAKYAVKEIDLVLSEDDWVKIKLVDKYYSSQQFRYPPYEPRKSKLNHQQLLEAVEKLRTITAGLLVFVWQATDGYAIDK